MPRAYHSPAFSALNMTKLRVTNITTDTIPVAPIFLSRGKDATNGAPDIATSNQKLRTGLLLLVLAWRVFFGLAPYPCFGLSRR